MVLKTWTHYGFEYLSPRDYVDTKYGLAYEQNPYSAHRKRYKTWDRHALKSRQVIVKPCPLCPSRPGVEGLHYPES
jgi:hypothetical protein